MEFRLNERSEADLQTEEQLRLPYQTKQKNKKAVLSQGEPRDAAVNFNKPTVCIFYNSIVRAVSPPQHGFLVDLCLHCQKVISTRKNQSDRIFNADQYILIMITLNY